MATVMVAVMVTGAGCSGRDEGSSANSGETGIEGGEAGEGAESGPLLDLGGSEGGEGLPTAEGGDTDCIEITAEIAPVIPNIVMLIDQSGSMDDDFGGQSRWVALYETLMDPLSGVVKPLEDRIRFGLTLYTSDEGFEGGTCPLLQEIDPALNNHATIDAMYSLEVPTEDTPTGESLAAVATKLANLPLDGPPAIVLATDGEPDTCAIPNPQTGQADSVAAAQAAYALGVPTYVISVGDQISDGHLQDMANAGVGLDPQGNEDAPYYKTLDAADLFDAFDAIIGDLTPCEYTINGVVDLEAACEGKVWLDGVLLECGVDWQLLDESTLQLLGAACEILRDGEAHELEASWPCGAIDIP